ncbi:MAG: BON domain-containing protein [Bacteroidales bacterium]|nr:BON domain-containing protein [Bacteroidales bacterium]
MKTKLLSLISLLFLLGVGLTACDKVKDTDLQETATQITATIQDASDVKIKVNDHIATLSGTVEEEATKQRVETSVLAIEGVKSVINNIKVLPPAPVVVEKHVVEKVSDQLTVATRKGKLNVHNKPGVEEYVITVVDHGETLTLMEKTTDKWWHIKTENDVEGYCYSPYLEEQ